MDEVDFYTMPLFAVKSIQYRAKRENKRLGWVLFNSLPPQASAHVVCTDFDPYFNLTTPEEISDWIDNHLIFDGLDLIALFDGNDILWERLV